jgi:hypothetical protein
MLTSRRDYILSMIEQAARLLAQVVFRREAGQNQEALQAVVMACERLFGLEGDRLFSFTPEQHWAMLTEGMQPEEARDRVLLYAALNAEAGRIYATLGNRPAARGSSINALRLTLKAQAEFPQAGLPDFTPKVAELLTALQDEPLDAETAALVAEKLNG